MKRRHPSKWLLRASAPALEVADGAIQCVEADGEARTIVVGMKKRFTFDHVLPPASTQTEMFSKVEPLLAGCFEGYNATVFAYGQTGSGKTFTMGTAFGGAESEPCGPEDSPGTKGGSAALDDKCASFHASWPGSCACARHQQEGGGGGRDELRDDVVLVPSSTRRRSSTC